MKLLKTLAIAVIVLLLLIPAAAFSMRSLTAKHSNQGYITDYLFSLSTQYSYPWATARIDFPIEYSLSNFQFTMDCQISNSGMPTEYRQVQCWIQPATSLASYFVVGSVYVQLDRVVGSTPFFILLRNIANPINRDLTSYFTVALEVQDTQIECDKAFARLLLTAASPPISTATATYSTSPSVSVVGQGSTYIFKIPVSNFGSWYSNSELISVRAIFPSQFSTYNPLCFIAYQITSFDLTYIPADTSTFESRSSRLQCGRISNFSQYLANNILSIKIETVVNPLSAKYWPGITFQIVRSIHNEIVEIVQLGSSVNVVMESFIGSVKQTNNFRNATNVYYLYLNHDVILAQNSMLQVTIGNGSAWKVHNVVLLGGFTSPSTAKATISNGPASSTISLTDYGTASRKTQQYLTINLTSPVTVGNHLISVLAQINSSNVGYWAGNLIINSTYGEFDLLSFSAVRKKSKLGANETGSLQLIFFLNYQLPESQGLKNGSLKVAIYPQLTAPNPDVNGVLKCYFKGIYDASNCTLDNSDPTKSIFTIISPPLEAYQYSEVPILITTEGAIDQNYTGFPINPLVTRYRFETSFFLYNSSTMPSEVYYGEWIADAVQMKTATASSLSHQCNELTHVQVNFTMPDLSTITASQELRIKVQFMSHPVTKINAWDATLGYSADRIYKEYPCLTSGLPGTRIRCDLYTYSASSALQPYNNLHLNQDKTGPLFIIYGFTNSGLTGAAVTIQLPNIKIGSIVNVPAMIKVSILEETPTMLQPYVQLFYQNVTIFTTLPSISIVETAVPTSQSIVLPVQTSQQFNITWNPTNPSLITYIKYEISSNYFPSFSTSTPACTISKCFSFGLPANWIVQKPSLPVGASYSMQSLWVFITTIPFLATQAQAIPIHITTYDAVGNTVNKVFMNYNYAPQSLVGYFDFLEPIYYAGLEQWYSISFSNSPVTVSTYPFIRLQLDSNLIFTSPVQCNSTTILPFNASGLMFKLESTTSLLVYNIMQISASSTYQMNCRMQTSANKYSSSISPQINIQIHHNYTIGDSYTAVVNNVTLQQAPVFPNKAKPFSFKIDNPQILNQQPQINYVGSLFIDFTSNTTNLGSTSSLKIILSNHRYNKAGWTTPSGSNSDPPVCFINSARFDCNWTNNPLTITINKPSFNVGSNRIELTSEYVAPYNGVKFPGSAGEYAITLSLLGNTSTTLTSMSFFANILPHSLLHLEASSFVKDIATESVYLVNFTIPTWATFPNACNHANNYSRIFIEFPTKVNGQTLFSSNLGGYNGLLNERVGCSFVLGAPYISVIAGQQLKCILIPPEFDGGNVKIQIINHAGFTSTLNSVAVYIFKIFNPVIAYDSFDLKVSIIQYQVNTGFVYPIYSGKYSVFLDPHSSNSAPIKALSIDNETTTAFFDTTLNVGNYGPISLTAQSLTSNYLQDPYYVIFKLPPFLPPENNQVVNPFKLCNSLLFELCITSPQIQYVLAKARNSPSPLQVYIRNYPAYTSQTNSIFQASVIEQGRYVGDIVYNITASYRWKQILGSLTLNSVVASGSALKLDLGRKYTQILVKLTTLTNIPATGTIQIVFSSNITKIYPNCRSATGVGSVLYSAAGFGALGFSGQIGCSVQNINHWVITGFQALTAPSFIAIRGFIDLPSVPGTIGTGEIITYADDHETDIYSNGSRIDYIKSDFGLIVSSTQAMNINPDIFMSQRSVLTAGYVGEFRFVFTLSSPLSTLDYIEFSMYKNDIRRNSGGFALTTRPKVCEFVRVDTEERIGCFVDWQTQTFIFMHEVVLYQLKAVENLQASVMYELRLTTQSYNLPEGIAYPTSPGTYKIDFLTNYTQSGVIEMEQRYIDVVGTPFTKLVITQFNFLSGYYSPFWVQLAPSTPILTTHQIVLEFPTLSNDGTTNLFLDNLGWSSINNGEGIPVDIFDCGLLNTFMNCRLFYGSYLYARPAKIICGNLQSTIAAGQTLKFAFAMTNPAALTSTTLSQISIPIFVYSYNPSLFQKINYNTVNSGAVVNNGNATAVPTAYFATTNNQLDMKNEVLYLSRYNSKALTSFDYYVVQFKFPLRVNTNVPSLSCRDNLGSVIGTLYYHENLRTVICDFTVALAVNSLPTFANLALTGFTTPWYALTNAERVVTAIASYQNSLQSQTIFYYDLFPLLPPRSIGFSSPLFQLSPVLAHNIACQQNDYIFTMRLQLNPSTNYNLQYTKMILIAMPNTGLSDFQAVNTDCMQHSTSTIQIISCMVDPTTRTIQIKIVPGYYQNGNTVAVVTRGLAIRNPCSNFGGSTFNSMRWNVYYLSFENGTAITPSVNYAYMTINSGNMQSTSLSISYENAVSSSYTYNPFNWFEIPYERYYNEFLQYDVNQYSPFQFQFQVSTAIPAVTYNKLSVPFGSNYVPCGTQYSVDDLSIFTPVCYLHNTRINRCFVDLTTNTTYMEFNFSLPANTNIHAYFSIIDPRNPQFNGYSYIGTEDVTQLTIKLQSLTNTYLYMTPPFEAFQTQSGPVGLLPVRGITFGTINYANNVPGQLNVLDMVLTVSRTDISALKFQIPMVDESNNQIFGASYKTSFFNLENGDEYPCGNNQLGIAQTSNHKCYLFYGSYNVMGSPVTIIMTDFNQGTNINVRLMMINPSTWNAWISVKVKAYTGTQDELSLYGGNFAGFWNFQSVFQINGAGPYYTTYRGYVCCSWLYFTPSASTWRDLTTWTVDDNFPVYPSWSIAGDYVIIELLTYKYINGSPDDQVCTVNFNYFSNGNTDDVIVLKNKQGRQEKTYFIKKWAGASWSVQYFKCKHYNNNIRIWYNRGKTISSIVDYYNGGQYQGYYNLVSFQYSLNYFYIFPLDTKTYLEMDLTSAITTVISQNFVWDNNVKYVLSVQTSGFCPSISKCVVVQGLVSSYMNMPITCVPSGCSVLISGFTQVLLNPRLGKYRVKVELQHSSYSLQTGWSYYSPVVNMYAHASATGNTYLDWYIFSASTSFTNLFVSYNQPLSQFWYQSCHIPTAPNLYYSHYKPYAPSTDFTINLIKVGMNAAQTSIQLHIELTPKHNIIMNTGYSYAFPQFRFLVNNFPFFCNAVSKFIITLHRFSSSYPLSFATNPGGMITCSRMSEVEINFYYWNITKEWGQIWAGGVQGALWYTDSTLEFDIEMLISSTVESIYYREWISVTTFVDLYQWSGPYNTSFNICRSGCLYEANVCEYFAFSTQFITVAFSEDLWQPLPSLFNSVTLQPLTNNIGQATEMSIIFTNALFAFGPISYGKLLLVQINQNINPFTYLNSSSTLMNRIQCKCVTDNAPGVTLDQTCYFRDVGLSSLNTAITIDIQLAYWMSATCYFPEWKITAGTLSVTAKLTNDYGGFPSYYSTYTTYGSYYQTISTSIFFSNSAALTTATITESSTPTIYSATSQVNTFQNDYTLTISLPQATAQAIVYVDFQKGGIIPNLQLCTTTYFLFCRIYTTLRHIMIAKFKLPTSAGGSLVFDSNFLFNTYLPTHWEYGVNSDYSIIARVIQNSADNFYTFKGTFPRIAANLLPATINATVNPQRTTGNVIAGFTTNIILSFNIANLSLYSYYTNNNAHIDITCSNAAILSTNRGCTVVSVINPLFQFYCQIFGGTLTIQNRYYNTVFTSTGLIQVIIGITNPATATPFTFTIKGYQYYISATNYGLSFTGTASYTPTVYTGIMQPNQLKLYPFNTKVYSSTNAPIRMGFKLSTTIGTMTYPSYFFVINGLNVVGSYTSFQCLFRQFSTFPTSNQQTLFPNSYRNYKQGTQHTDLYTFCYPVAAGLQVEAPRNQGLMSGVYYQLVIMPAGTTVSGFANLADSLFKIIAHPLPSERIDQLYLYTPASFTLTSIQVVTKRPLSPNALLIAFSINFNSPTTYPSHYLEIVFRDLDMTSIRSPYNTPGSQVPCTLSSLFLALTRTQSPLCIIQKLDIILGTIVMRVTQIGNLVIGNYQITFDDFLLPDLINPPLEDSSPFTLCLRFHQFSLNTHYQNCFDELFVIDYSTNAVTPIEGTDTIVLSNSTYGSVGVTGAMKFTSYPMTSTSQLHQKFMMRINQGYAGTTSAPITFPGYTPLWYNPLINIYIYKQKTLTTGTAVTLSLTGLINPQAYDSTFYTTGTPSVEFTFFNTYHPVEHYTYSQPIFSSFTLQDAQIYAASVLYSDDIKFTVPFNSPLIYQMQLVIIDTPATIASKKIDNVVIAFTSNVTKIDRCWVDTKLTGQAFQLDGECAIVSSNTILLQGINSAYTSNNLTIYIQLRVTGYNISYSTTVNCMNGQAQYKSSGYQLFNDVNSSRIVYPLLDFTENLYTPYYYETVTQLAQSSQAKYLYFSLQLPKDLTAVLSTMTITFPLTTTYIPNNGTTQTRMVCEWLTTDRYSRKTLAGVRSVCTFTSPKSITIQAPYAGLPRLSSSNTPITYLLKIREFFLTTTLFKTPTTTQNVEITFTHTESVVTLQDTLTVYPYNNFASGQLSVNTYTLTAGELNTYDISFTPQSTISIGKEAILELSIDSRYMPAYLGLKSLYQQYGLDTTNSSWINNLGCNVAYSLLPNNWINGIPYSGYTSTNANAQQTCVYIDPKTYRVALLLESAYTAGVAYNWKIPLLLNPSAVNSTFRMNLTLYTYWSGLANPQKELFYEIINPYKTSSNISQPVNYTFSSNALTNTVQSSAASINIDFGFPFVPDSTSVAELKISNRGAALIGLANFYTMTYSDASYLFYFFKRINLVLAKKMVNDSSIKINFGSIESTNTFVDYFGYDWVKIHSSPGKQTVYNAGSLFQPLISCSIVTVTPVLLEGLSSQHDSEFLQQFSFTTPCSVPLNSTLLLAFNSSLLSWSREAPCYTSFRSSSCTYNQNGTLIINFNENIAAGATFTFAIYLQVLQSYNGTNAINITGYIYALPDNPNAVIDFIPLLTSLSLVDSSVMTSGAIENVVILPLYENTYMPLLGRLKPQYLPLTYIEVTHPFPWTANSHHRFMYRLNGSQLLNSTSSLSWIEANQTQTLTNFEHFVILPNALLDYSLSSSLQYTFIISSTYDSGKLNNFTIGPVGSFYNFIYESDTEYEYQEVYPVPVADLLTLLVPTRQVSQSIALGLRFKMQTHSLKMGDMIEIYLDSHNLVRGMHQFSTTPIECAEGVTGTLSTSSPLSCSVYQYSQSQQPMIIRAHPTKAVPMNTQVQIWISPIVNPSATMVAGAIVKVTVDCLGEQRCQIYEARGYFSTVSNMNIIDYGNGVATFIPSNLEVQMKAVSHTFAFIAQTATAAMLDYPENYDDVMTSACSYGLGKCIVFPNQKRAIVVPIAPASISSLQLLSMNNGKYILPPSNYINLTILSSSAIELYNVNHTTLTTIKTNYIKAIPTAMTITPTQTPNLFLRNYMNTAVITLSGLYTDQYVNAFYIHAPSDIVTWDTTYCNATLATPTNNPYPTRLTCTFINDTTLSVAVPEGVSYLFGTTDGYLITVNCKFSIKDFLAGQDTLYVSIPVTSGTFNSYGSNSAKGDDSHYYITQASQTIIISQNQIPPIGNIEFTEENYMQRFANINDTVYFDLLFDPATTDPISSIQIRLPKEFGYPPVGSHDACKMIARTTFQVQSCLQIRRDDNTFIVVTPSPTYDNGPVIITIANQNHSNWFTAPSMAGSWYNYTVSAYAADGTLLQREYSENCSTIGGLQLHIPNMTIRNGMDAMMEEMIDVSFVVGSQALRQGYSSGLQQGDYYTNIKIQFENWGAFSNLLGTGYKNQQLIGCVTQGLTKTREIQCLLVGGSDVEHQPAVLISGYERVSPYTNITVSLPNILMLAANTRNVLWASVVLLKVGSWKQSYLYNPESLVFKQSSNLALLSLNSLDLGYVGLNIVRSPSTFYVSFNPSVDINAYFLVKFPTGFLSKNYSAFSSTISSGKLQIFYRSDLIRIYPNGGIHAQGVTINYTISNFPSTAFVMAAQTWPIVFQGYNNYKQIHQQTVNLVFQSYPCSVTFGLISASSLYSYDTNVSYTFEVQLPTLSADTSTFALIIPIDYPSLFSFGVSCSVAAPLACSVMTATMLIVRHVQLLNSSKILINLLGITNPAGTNHTFILQTFNGDNLDQVMCQSTLPITTRKASMQKCQSALSVSQVTINQQAKYEFNIICPQTLRNNSQVKIKISNDFLYSNHIGPLTCWADKPLNLKANNCQLVYQNATLYIWFKQIIIQFNEASLALNAVLNNSIFAKAYSFTSTIDLYGSIYATTGAQSVQLLTNTVGKISSIAMYNVPGAGGSNSIYVLKLPSKFVSNNIQVDFPAYFSIAPTVAVSAYFTNNTNWHQSLSYFELLQLTYQSQVTASVSSINNGKSTVSITNFTFANGTTWAFLLFKFIANPSYYDSTFNFTVRSLNAYKQLSSVYEGPFSIQINVPASSIHMIGLSTGDSDLLMLTMFNITYRVDQPIYTNSTSFIITPPHPAHLDAIDTLQCCLILNYSQLIECHSCSIGKQEIQFKINTQGLLLLSDQIFTIQLTTIFTPDDVNPCLSYQDYLKSYYSLMVFRNGTTLTHESIAPSNDFFTPCQEYLPQRGDILFNPPITLYAGLAYQVPLGITRPSKMVRVFMSSKDLDLKFSPNETYFNSYDLASLPVYILVNPNSQAKSASIKIRHEESIIYSIFRDNLPIGVEVRTDTQEYVVVQQSQYFSVGNFITIPVIVTHIASYDMYLTFNSSDSSSLFEFEFTTILIPALTQKTSFRYRYTGDIVPQTLNVSLTLHSSNLLKHALKPATIYFFFSITQQFQTLPPVMKLNVMHNYINNSHFATRKAYNANTSTIYYDQLRPYILMHEDVEIGSTKASIRIFTRHEADVYYVLFERGTNFSKPTSLSIRTHSNARFAVTSRNSSQYVNAYTIINFTKLTHQTMYSLYAMAHDSLGDSQADIIHNFMTNPLPNAVQLRIDTSKDLTDSVYIVHAISQILNIDILRVKDVDSYIIQNNTWTKNTASKNQLYYRNLIVISPSLIDDTPTPLDLVKNFLLNNPTNRLKLKKIFPEFIDNFDERISTGRGDELPLIELIINLPKIKNNPSITHISYYNLTFTYELWSKGIIYTVAVQKQLSQRVSLFNISRTKCIVGQTFTNLTDNIPYSKQIIQGENSYNQNASIRQVTKTNSEGKVLVSLSNLKPGTSYQIYVSFTTPQPYEPILYASNANIMKLEVTTLENPNIKGNDEGLALKELKSIDPEMYDLIMTHKVLEKSREGLH